MLSSIRLVLPLLLLLPLVHSAALAPDVSSLGYLKCVELESGQVFGYVRKKLNSYGEYIGVSPSDDPSDVKARLLVKIDDVSSNQSMSILAQNAPNKNYPFFGAIAGDTGSSIGPNANYLLIGDATNSLRKAQSAFWQLNATTGELKPAWVNDDKTITFATVGYLNGAFAMTGDTKAFEKEYDDEDVTWLKFIFSTD
jgi:hypothetical protein